MQFSLKALMFAVAVVPPACWLAYVTMRRFDQPQIFPDPIGTLGVAAWIAIFYNCVYKRLPTS
jgi:hypothetical protein